MKWVFFGRGAAIATLCGASISSAAQGLKIPQPSHHADIAFQLAVANGVRAHHWKFGDMAPVPGLTPDYVAHITAFVRSEQRKVGIR